MVGFRLARGVLALCVLCCVLVQASQVSLEARDTIGHDYTCYESDLHNSCEMAFDDAGEFDCERWPVNDYRCGFTDEENDRPNNQYAVMCLFVKAKFVDTGLIKHKCDCFKIDCPGDDPNTSLCAIKREFKGWTIFDKPDYIQFDPPPEGQLMPLLQQNPPEREKNFQPLPSYYKYLRPFPPVPK